MEKCKEACQKHAFEEKQEYALNHIRKEEILERLREKGCRITKQRSMLIDVILESDCSCCKEVYYIAAKKMPDIGIATIYRMINSLEEIGAIKKKNIHCVCCNSENAIESCVVEMEDKQRITLDQEMLQQIMQKGMEACGYTDIGKVNRVMCTVA